MSALLCDLTLCTPDVVFGNGNFRAGFPPGDGMYLALRELAGAKRAHVVYTGQGIPADEALRLGIVNEVVPRSDLMPRALDLAAQIMARPRTARHLTHGSSSADGSAGWSRNCGTPMPTSFSP